MKSVLPIFTSTSTSPKFFSFLAVLLLATSSFAGIIVVPATNGTNISADKSANAADPGFTRMDDISLSENKAGDFANTIGKSKTLILTAPTGWMFNTATGNVLFSKAGDLKAASITVNSNNIIIHFATTGTLHIDMLTIQGIEIESINGAVLSGAGQLYISTENGGTATIAGLKATANKNGRGGTNFASLSQVAGDATNLAFINKPDSSVVGVNFDQQPVIITQDQFGNETTNGLLAVQNVKVKLSSGTGNLAGMAVLNIGTAGGNGKVSFSGLSINTEGMKKLMATSGSLVFAVTNEFTVHQVNTNTEISADDYDPDMICLLEPMNIQTVFI